MREVCVEVSVREVCVEVSVREHVSGGEHEGMCVRR